MILHGETWEDVEKHTFKRGEMDVPFDNGYGGVCGVPFTLWTRKRVYFPACYDGSEWAQSVPRHPCNQIVGHVGGG